MSFRISGDDNDDAPVFAIKVHDDYHFIAEKGKLEVGATFGAEQCDDCGCCRYLVKSQCYAVCDGDNLDGQDIPGCGAHYNIVLEPSYNVVF